LAIIIFNFGLPPSFQKQNPKNKTKQKTGIT
jgi:hypothetical protein